MLLNRQAYRSTESWRKVVHVPTSALAIIIPYADNLNVAGTDQSRVQAVKDCVVARLREVGFRVHEETDACTIAQSLGFVIDGEHGVVHPIVDRWDKTIKVFEWRSHGPRVSGRAIERLLGHTAHICMLRRELFSSLRSLYDFVYAMYNRRHRLWPSARREARWCMHILKLRSVDLHRGWSDDITASDASLSGIAVCRRALSEDLQSELGNVKEVWRYKSKVVSKPRDSALG